MCIAMVICLRVVQLFCFLPVIGCWWCWNWHGNACWGLKITLKSDYFNVICFTRVNLFYCKPGFVTHIECECPHPKALLLLTLLLHLLNNLSMACSLQLGCKMTLFALFAFWMLLWWLMVDLLIPKDEFCKEKSVTAAIKYTLALPAAVTAAARLKFSWKWH